MMTTRSGGCQVFGCLSEASRPAMPRLTVVARPATPTTPPPVAPFRQRAASRGPAYLVASACQSVGFLEQKFRYIWKPVTRPQILRAGAHNDRRELAVRCGCLAR